MANVPLLYTKTDCEVATGVVLDVVALASGE